MGIITLYLYFEVSVSIFILGWAWQRAGEGQAQHVPPPPRDPDRQVIVSFCRLAIIHAQFAVERHTQAYRKREKERESVMGDNHSVMVECLLRLNRRPPPLNVDIFRTSSISHEILGFDSEGHSVDYSTCNTADVSSSAITIAYKVIYKSL